MPFHFENLDEKTRIHMVEEIQLDIAEDKLYRSARLNQRAQGSWGDILIEAAQNGSEITLANAIREDLNEAEARNTANGVVFAKNPSNAAETLAEGEFNRYYIRGLCRRAISEGVPRLQIYRAKQVSNPRSESSQIIGNLVMPEVTLTDLRGSNGVDTALGLPSGPNSGISLRMP